MAFTIELSDLDGTIGFILNGIDVSVYSGTSVSGAGDVNGDGFADVIIGAPLANSNGTVHAGRSYIVFGKAGGFDTSIDLSSLDGTNGFVLGGIDAGDLSGYSVGGSGDVNGDGFDDLIIGAPFADSNGKYYSGESYVVFGKAGGFDSSLDLSSLNGTNGFVLSGIEAGDQSGYSVSGAGDVNGDGFDDLIVGAPDADPNGTVHAGRSYMLFGKAGGFDANLDLSSLDGTNGFVLSGIEIGDLSGSSVSGAGDVNGDGFADVIIGAPLASPAGTVQAGRSYVVFGKAGGFDSNIDLSSLDGTNGFVLGGIGAGDQSGFSVSSAGDVNGDGFADVIIGAPFADPHGTFLLAGESYVVFGKAGGFDASIDLGSLNGSDGFVINGIHEFDRSGWSVNGVGDVNGDGCDDLIIGAPFVRKSYVVLGKTSGFDSSIDLSSLDGTNGFVINGIYAFDRSGWSVNGAGDVNGDGFDDLIIGAKRDSFAQDAESYVVFGRASFLPVDQPIVGTNGDDSLNGVIWNDTILGLSGNDTLLGNARHDSMDGGPGNDSLDGGGGNDSLYGGSGDDILTGDDGNDSIEGEAGNDTGFGGAGDDYLGEKDSDGDTGDDFYDGGDGSDTLEGGSGNDTLEGGADNDTLNGGIGDDSLVGGDGTDTAVINELRRATAIATVDDDHTLQSADGTDTIDASTEIISFLDGKLYFGPDTAAAQVNRLYLTALDHEPDALVLTDLTAEIQNGNMSLFDLARDLVDTPEWQDKYGELDNDDFVTALYNNVLDRDPDQGGYDYWRGWLDGNSYFYYFSRPLLVFSFSACPELKQKTAGEIAGGVWTVDKDAAFVLRAYEAGLDQDPDASGLSSWIGALRAGTTSHQDIADAFAETPDFIQRYGTLTNQQLVEQMYLNTLERPGDAPGVAYWTAYLDGGASRGQLVLKFAECQELIDLTENLVTDGILFV